MSPDSSTSRALRPLLIGFLVSVSLAGCSDDASDPVGDDTDASTTTGGSDDDDATGTPSGDGSIRGSFLFVDGSQAALDVDANYERNAFGDVVQHTCSGSDLDRRLSLGISWRDDTTAGTHIPSLSDGPGFLAAWESADGEGIRATLPSGGEITFDEVGHEPGDVVSGTAHAMLSPDQDDPDDRVSEIVDIEFECVVTAEG